MKEILSGIFTKGALKTVLTFIAGGSFVIIGYVKFVQPFLEKLSGIENTQQQIITKINEPSVHDSVAIELLLEVKSDVSKIKKDIRTHTDILKDVIENSNELKNDQKYYFYRLENSYSDSSLKKKTLSNPMYSNL